MDIWKKRSPEVAYLINPAFCSIILYHVIFEYQKKSKQGFPFVLIYLLLPMLLHKSTCDRIDSKTSMVRWLQRNPELLVGYPDRARSLVRYTNEAIEFLLQQSIIEIADERLNIIKTISKAKIISICNPDIFEYLRKAEHVGRWFANMGAEENIYAAWGVKP